RRLSVASGPDRRATTSWPVRRAPCPVQPPRRPSEPRWRTTSSSPAPVSVRTSVRLCPCHSLVDRGLCKLTPSFCSVASPTNRRDAHSDGHTGAESAHRTGVVCRASTRMCRYVRAHPWPARRLARRSVLGSPGAYREVWSAAERRASFSHRVVRQLKSARRKTLPGCPSPATRRDRHFGRDRADRDVGWILGSGLHVNRRHRQVVGQLRDVLCPTVIAPSRVVRAMAVTWSVRCDHPDAFAGSDLRHTCEVMARSR